MFRSNEDNGEKWQAQGPIQGEGRGQEQGQAGQG